MTPESPKEIEAKIKALLREHKGVDIVLAVGYTIGCKHSVLLTSADRVACRKLCRTLWASLQDESATPKSKEPDEPDED